VRLLNKIPNAKVSDTTSDATENYSSPIKKRKIKMSLAFISDIHANLPALEAVLKDIEKHKPDNIYCLGDLVNFAGWDNEVIELIRKRNITTIQGNHDEGIGRGLHDFSFSFATAAQKIFGYASINKVNETIKPENRNYLNSLPFMLQLEFRFPFHECRIALVHGSISSNNEYVKSKVSDDYLLEMMDAIHSDILLMGHTHIPFHRSIYCEEENKRDYKHAINVGSVGKPKHGNNQSCYTIIEINHEAGLNDANSIMVRFEYVRYDVKKVIEHIHAIGLSDAYDDFLLHGES
jgi:putative phosphoesterase